MRVKEQGLCVNGPMTPRNPVLRVVATCTSGAGASWLLRLIEVKTTCEYWNIYSKRSLC